MKQGSHSSYIQAEAQVVTVCTLAILYRLASQSTMVHVISESSMLMTHRWLQDVFDVPLIIMLTDDEKYLFGNETRTIEQIQAYTASNVKDIVAVGFDPKKTFIFSDYEFMGGAFYRNVSRLSKCITLNVARAVFGFGDR